MEMILAQTTAPKVSEWASYGNYHKVTQNPHFLEKCKGGTKGNFLVQKAAAKVLEWPSYVNFRNVNQDPHFLKKCKGGTKGNFSKIAQKVAFF